MPPSLLGRTGYLSLQQTRLETLSLINEGRSPGTQPERLLCASRISKTIATCRGRDSVQKYHIRDLHDVFECNARHPVLLELDVVNWDIADGRVGYKKIEDLQTACIKCYLAWKILRLQSDATISVFSALRKLSLSNMSFEKVQDKNLVYALNIGTLHTRSLIQMTVTRSLSKRSKTSTRKLNSISSPSVTNSKRCYGLSFLYLSLDVGIKMSHWNLTHYN